MTNVLNTNPVSTILTVLVTVVGGVIAVIHPDTLSFSGYCQDVGIAAGGFGVLGIGRSLANKG